MDRPTRRSWTPSLGGSLAAALVALAIYLGSRGLRYFDATLVGYATATVFLAFGVVYRYALWVSSPPTRRYLRRGWQAFFSDSATGPGYTIYVLGFRTLSFDALSFLGWVVSTAWTSPPCWSWPAAAGSCGGGSATARPSPASASATTSSP